MFRLIEKNSPLASVLCAVFSVSTIQMFGVPQDAWALAAVVLFASHIVSQYAAMKKPSRK